MQKLVRGFILAAIGLAFSIVFAPSMQSELQAQGPLTVFPRTKDGKPDLTGVWQALNTAAWDIQDHTARMGFPGSRHCRRERYSIPSGHVGQKENAEKRDLLDPETKCYLPGVPRATYMPFPFRSSSRHNSSPSGMNMPTPPVGSTSAVNPIRRRWISGWETLVDIGREIRS